MPAASQNRNLAPETKLFSQDVLTLPLGWRGGVGLVQSSLSQIMPCETIVESGCVELVWAGLGLVGLNWVGGPTSGMIGKGWQNVRTVGWHEADRRHCHFQSSVPQILIPSWLMSCRFVLARSVVVEV